MQSTSIRAIAGICLVAATFATPTPAQKEAVTPAAVIRQASGSPITNQNQLEAALGSFSADFQSVSAAVDVGIAIFTNIVPAPGPTAIPQLIEEVYKITSANPGDIIKSGAEILAGGFAGGDYIDIAASYLLESSTDSINLRPAPGIYPKADPNDAPYSLSESDLRKVIYIPFDFTYGQKEPIIFLPGSGARGGPNFAGNLAKLVKDNDLGDPVYLNLPSENLADIQVAAE